MISIDSNVVLRIITDDDPEQVRIARNLVENNEIFVSLLVLVECEWVLRSAYAWPVSRIADALEAFLIAPAIHTEFRELATWAISRFRGGADLADMIHLVMSRDTERFASFERKLAQRAGPDSPVPVLALLN